MHDRELRLMDIEIASEEPDMTEEQELQFYLDEAVRTKKDLLSMIKEAKEFICQYIPEILELKVSKTRYERLQVLFDKFYADVETMFLMEPLTDWWAYGLSVRNTGISLKLEHLTLGYDGNSKITKEHPTRAYFCSDEDFTIHVTKARLLSLEEFGALYDVPGDTVRQWIRRGKIREAVKLGNDWRIPELVDLPSRGYTPCHYSWDSEIPCEPEGIPDINQYDSIYIQSSKETGKWDVTLEQFWVHDGKRKTIVMTGKEKEKLELFLISQPMVECPNNYIGEVHYKHPKKMRLLADHDE